MNSKQKIKYIIFDISEVVLTGIKDASFALIEKYNLNNISHHDLGFNKRATPLIIPIFEDFCHGKISEDEYLTEVLKAYPQIGNIEDLKQHIRSYFKEIEGTREIILRLKKLNYKIALLSVHAKEWVDYCEEKFHFHKLFDVHSYSHETKVSKPDPLAFKDVLDKLQAKANECLFIDDQQRNLDSAKELGFATILFTDAQNLKIELNNLLPDFKIKKTELASL